MLFVRKTERVRERERKGEGKESAKESFDVRCSRQARILSCRERIKEILT